MALYQVPTEEYLVSVRQLAEISMCLARAWLHALDIHLRLEEGVEVSKALLDGLRAKLQNTREMKTGEDYNSNEQESGPSFDPAEPAR